MPERKGRLLFDVSNNETVLTVELKWDCNCILNCMRIECFTFRLLVWLDSNICVTPDCHSACCLESVRGGLALVFSFRWLVFKLPPSSIQTAACGCSITSIQNADVRMWDKTYNFNMELFQNLRINNQQDASRIQNFYFVTKLYMFRASTVPIVRSYQLYTWQLVRFML